MSEMEKFRAKIDQIDAELLRLYEDRMEIARQVGAYKAKKGLNVADEKRERELLDSKMAMLKDQSLRAGARRLFELLMSQSRNIQYANGAEDKSHGNESLAAYQKAVDTVRKPLADSLIIYQGRPGAYGEEASALFFGETANKTSADSFEDVFGKLAAGLGDYGVVPIENNSTGAIAEIYDLLAKYDFYIVGEQSVAVEHCLIAPKGAALENITHIYSHDQGFRQSVDFLQDHQDWCHMPFFNTAVAAKFVADSGDITKAAIASRRAAELYGLSVLAQNINYNAHNHTRFAIISPYMEIREGSDKISAVFTLAHSSGSLYRILSIFALNGLNLLKIESRPIKEKGWEYMFFADFSGNIKEEGMDSIIADLTAACNSLRILGNYRANDGLGK